MIIYAGIDGTSTEEDTYEKTYYNSFVNRLHRNELVPFSDTWYLRGPFLSGFDTDSRARKGYNYVRDMWKSGKAKAVFLGGHSRGGAAVIEVAKWLKEENIPVECLILFDAVDRTNTLGGTIWNTPIASTVKKVIYPQRDIFRTFSRLSFGNCGFTRESNNTVFLHEKFFATHSGIGGVPWLKATIPGTSLPNPTGFIWEPGEINSSQVTVAKDEQGSQHVWGWAKSHIAFAFFQCEQRLNRGDGVKPNPDFQIPNQPNAPHLGGGKRIHIVQPGDWLSKIAIKYYGDMNKWHLIYDVPENKQKIGPDPNLIKPGQELIIP